jgi:hypothetical protein
MYVGLGQVIGEGISPQQQLELLCADGTHPNAQTVCDDGSHPGPNPAYGWIVSGGGQQTTTQPGQSLAPAEAQAAAWQKAAAEPVSTAPSEVYQNPAAAVVTSGLSATTLLALAALAIGALILFSGVK